MNETIDKKYCLGVGASSKANDIDAVRILQEILNSFEIEFSFIATLEKFADCFWLAYLEKHFSVPILFFTDRSLQQYQSQIVTPSNKIMQKIGYYGVAEAAALAAFEGNAKLVIPKTICSYFTYAIACENH